RPRPRWNSPPARTRCSWCWAITSTSPSTPWWPRRRSPSPSSSRQRVASQAARMYLTFYGLAEKPFSITPDPRYLFLGGQHAEALAHLVYGITEAGGFIQLTGEVGTGKTTIIRSLLSKQPDNA